ncbi:MAG: carboxypeptidase-like regulatory domain-containing protein, partial [Candidatus Marinimicrobia bacterium]|nr:carboxypeptidase-like regulatory domain-containing protein [Candidatus Neomarinimicrobiota bacterium]
MSGKISVVILAIILLPVLSLAQQGTVTGTITDESTGDAIAGANVILLGTNTGAAANNDGIYTIRNAPLGDYTLVVTAIGYSKTTAEVSISPGITKTVDIAMAVESVELSGLEVVAARARPRETPVAFTNVEKADMQFRLGP